MSIFIKGMDMPYGCANCSFLNGPVYDCRGRAEYFCNIPIDEICGKSVTDQVIDMYIGGSNGELYFADWCPLVEVPDNHGRLIDADDLPWENQRIFLTDTDEWGLPCRDIDNAPTVIPADKEVRDG